MLVIGISSCESSLERGLAAASNPCDPSCDPPSWCGVATTLCAGEEETPSLVEKLYSGFWPVTERDGGGAQDSVSCGHLPLLAGIALVA